MAVKWGDLSFTDAVTFSGSVPSTESGVYAIMTKPDPQNKPKTYTTLYFGETEDFSKRIDTNHEKYDCWNEKKINGLYYELYVMPNSSQEKRQKVESSLIKQYGPGCNEKT